MFIYLIVVSCHYIEEDRSLYLVFNTKQKFHDSITDEATQSTSFGIKAAVGIHSIKKRTPIGDGVPAH